MSCENFVAPESKEALIYTHTSRGGSKRNKSQSKELPMAQAGTFWEKIVLSYNLKYKININE